MKKSILVLSALLTLVVSGVCLQSCSSEYDEYTTEEYGYYTEEEIAAMKAIAEKYNTSINVDENYCGRKASLEEFENVIVQFVDLPGDYKLVELKNDEGYSLVKKTADVNRAKARVAELGDYGMITVGTVTPTRPNSNVPIPEPCTFYLSWTILTGAFQGTTSLSVNSPYLLYGNVDGSMSSVVNRQYVSVFENVTISYWGVNCGRYCIAGTYWAGGRSEFKITKVPESNI